MPGKQTIVSRGSPPVQHAGHSAAAVAQVTVVTAGELHPLCAKLLFARQFIRRASADAAWAAQAESELLAISGLQIAVVRYSQLMERCEGFAPAVLDTMTTSSADTMIIVSVSGRNAAGIDMAMAAKEKGMKVIAVTSLNYSTQVTSRHSSGKLLKDVSDIVLDICGVKGDSVLEDERVSEKFCSTSTVVAMTLLVGIVGQVIQNLADLGVDPPIWVSGNLDRGDEINAEHIRKYRGKVDIL